MLPVESVVTDTLLNITGNNALPYTPFNTIKHVLPGLIPLD